MWIGRKKCEKCLISQLLIGYIKILYRANFYVYKSQILKSLASKFRERSQNIKKSHVMLMVIHHSLYIACHGLVVNPNTKYEVPGTMGESPKLKRWLRNLDHTPFGGILSSVG